MKSAVNFSSMVDPLEYSFDEDMWRNLTALHDHARRAPVSQDLPDEFVELFSMYPKHGVQVLESVSRTLGVWSNCIEVKRKAEEMKKTYVPISVEDEKERFKDESIADRLSRFHLYAKGFSCCRGQLDSGEAASFFQLFEQQRPDAIEDI